MNVYELYGEELRYKGRFLSTNGKWVYYVELGGYVKKLRIAYARVLQSSAAVLDLADGLPEEGVYHL